MLLGTRKRPAEIGSEAVRRVQASHKASAAALPATLDWRKYNGKNYVTSIKDQGGCGACWVFSTAAELESQMLITETCCNTPSRRPVKEPEL